MKELAINDVQISPADIICGDADGALAVPHAYAERIADIAERIEETEARIVNAVNNGSSLVQARRELGYHDLQWKTS
jgi:regulator of RNase E activity RraA